MRFSRQKKKIISLVLAFGCIYAVNACAHPLGGSFIFHISNQAPKSDFGDITISSDSEPTKPCKNSSGDLFSIDIPSLGAGSTDFTKIGIQYGSTNDFCYADIQYGGKYTTKVKITWVAATDGGNGAVFHSITTKNGDPLGSDQAFTNWRDEINQQTFGDLIKVAGSTDSATKIYTLTYSRYPDKALPIKLSNNSNNDKLPIHFEIPKDAPNSHCQFPSGKTTSVEVKLKTSKSVYFSLQGPLITKQHSNFHCLADLVINDNKTKKQITTPINVVYHDESKTLTVEIATTMSTPRTDTPLQAFNVWNNTFAVNNGTMMKLEFSPSTPTGGSPVIGEVTFQPTDLPFPLLDKPYFHPAEVTNSLDYLANKLLTNDFLPSTDDPNIPAIFYDYKHNKKTSRDIAQHMLIAAGMMKLHSQIPDAHKNDDYSFSAWQEKFNTLNNALENKAVVYWSNKTKATAYWNCQIGQVCFLPYHGENDFTYSIGQTPDDTIAQTYLAVAYEIAGEATPPGDATNYKNISQKIQDAILKNNMINSVEVKGTQSTSIHFQGTDYEPGKTYSEAILPLIYLLFTQNKDLSTTGDETWNSIFKETLHNEDQFMTVMTFPILTAGWKGTYGDADINMSDDPYLHNPYTLSPLMTFGKPDDDADYVPRSLGAYLLVNPKGNIVTGDDVCTENWCPAKVLSNEMINGIDSLQRSWSGDKYVKISCQNSSDSVTCKKLGTPLTSLDMSSYLLAQLGLDAYFGRTDDYPPTDSPVDNSAQIADLRKSFQGIIKNHLAGSNGDIDISSIITAGLYIDGTFTLTLKDGTGKSSFHNPLIDGHINKTSKDIHYYFTLDPTFLTHQAQAPSGAQTSYTGE